MQAMKIVLISYPVLLEKEHELVDALFENELINCFHLRKPGMRKDEFENILERINPKYYRSISIHSNYSLIEKYNLSGIHMPEKIRKDATSGDLVKAARKKNINVSCSFHTLEELKEARQYNYAFISPVFNSITKENYLESFNWSELKKSLEVCKNENAQIIALGGIDEKNTARCLQAGFSGVALHGHIWKDFEIDNDIQKANLKLKRLSLLIEDEKNRNKAR
jgi:thiamine-phosphate pyrophosphorylase